MKYSHNVLVIESLLYEPKEAAFAHVRVIESKLKAFIKFICPETHNNFMTMNLAAENQGYSAEDSLKNVIQDFMNGNVNIVFDITASKNMCIANKKIDSLEIQISEPFKSLFEQLFNLQNWKIPGKVN